MSDKTMTLDELIAELRQVQVHVGEKADKDYEQGRESNPLNMAAVLLDQQIKRIEKNRPALERGMRGVLRFKRIYPPMGQIWALAGENGSAGISSVDGDYIWTSASKDKLQEIADFIGLTAVFEENAT